MWELFLKKAEARYIKQWVMVILHNFLNGVCVCVGWGFFVLCKFKTLKPMMLPVVQGMWHLKSQFCAV